MGREIKRTPVGFGPVGETWEGYLNPWGKHFSECWHCGGSGLSREANQLAKDWYDFAGTGRRWCNAITQDEVQALVDGGRLWELTRTWSADGGWEERDPPVIPTAAEVNEWNSGPGFGHDATNRWVCIHQRAKRLGILYGKCHICWGSGCRCYIPQVTDLHDEWEAYEPPEGDGYQVWETVSEGSPISPSMGSPELLAEWMGGHATGLDALPAEQWLEFIQGPGWAPSMVSNGAGVTTGVDALTQQP